MPISSRSYGTVAGVVSLVPRYADSGNFTSATRPSLAQVENWINETSAVVNALLADAGFSVPMTQTDAISLLAGLVESVVAEYADYANRMGRFWSDSAQDRGISMHKVLNNEISSWINQYAKGLENLGSARTEGTGSEIAYRETDEAGDTVVPLFQRKAYGERTQDWDK